MRAGGGGGARNIINYFTESFVLAFSTRASRTSWISVMVVELALATLAVVFDILWSFTCVYVSNHPMGGNYSFRGGRGMRG